MLRMDACAVARTPDGTTHARTCLTLSAMRASLAARACVSAVWSPRSPAAHAAIAHVIAAGAGVCEAAAGRRRVQVGWPRARSTVLVYVADRC